METEKTSSVAWNVVLGLSFWFCMACSNRVSALNHMLPVPNIWICVSRETEKNRPFEECKRIFGVIKWCLYIVIYPEYSHLNGICTLVNRQYFCSKSDPFCCFLFLQKWTVWFAGTLFSLIETESAIVSKCTFKWIYYDLDSYCQPFFKNCCDKSFYFVSLKVHRLGPITTVSHAMILSVSWVIYL